MKFARLATLAAMAVVAVSTERATAQSSVPPPPAVTQSPFDGAMININGNFPATGAASSYGMSTMLAINGQTLNYTVGQLVGTLAINGPSVTQTQNAQCNGVNNGQSTFVLSATQSAATLRVSVDGHLDVTSGACNGDSNTDNSVLEVTLSGQNCTFSYTDNYDYRQGSETKGQIVITQQPCEIASSVKPQTADQPNAAGVQANVTPAATAVGTNSGAAQTPIPGAVAAACTLGDQIVGTWGMRFSDGSTACFTYQFIGGGKMVGSSQNCSGGPGSDGTGTFSWSVNAACHVVLKGQGNSAEWTVSFNGNDEFTVAGQTGTYFRK
jgi:hypothetical protein